MSNVANGSDKMKTENGSLNLPMREGLLTLIKAVSLVKIIVQERMDEKNCIKHKSDRSWILLLYYLFILFCFILSITLFQ